MSYFHLGEDKMKFNTLVTAIELLKNTINMLILDLLAFAKDLNF